MQTRKQFSDIKTNLEKNRYYNNFQNNDASNNNINNNNNSNKAILNFNKIINNLKISLEKFDSSIKELKLNIDKDKEEQSQKIQELEETFNSKLNSLKTGQIYSKPIQKGKNEPDIYLKACQQMHVSPENTLVFEDALHALKTVKTAGFRSVGCFDAYSIQDQPQIKRLADHRGRFYSFQNDWTRR